MTKALSLMPHEADFYSQTAEQLARRLPGEVVQSAAGRHVILMTEGFNGLVRKSMETDFGRRENREAGEVCVTNFRGWPQLNIVGRSSSNKPQLTWLNELGRGEEAITNAGLVKMIAAKNGEKLKTPQEIFAYSVDVLDGKNVQESKSPLRIVENSDLPFDKRHIAFLRHAGSAQNSAGVGILAKEFEPVTSREQLESILDEIALELKVDPKKLRDPSFLISAVKKSSRLRNIIQQLADDE